MSRVRKSTQAESDLAEIWLHIALDNVDAADALLDRINFRLALISQNPGIGRFRPELRMDLRSFSVSSYLLFYRIESDGIYLIRVLHGARDLPNLFHGVNETPGEYRLCA